MTEIQLCAAIREQLAEALKDIQHPTDDSRGREQLWKAPEIFNGYLPPKRSDETPDFPCVIVRPSEGRTETGQGNIPQDLVSVKFLIGSYGKDESDYEYCLVILRRIINHFRAFPTLKNLFRMQPEVKWKMPDEQAQSVWFVEAMTTWEIPTPLENHKEDGYVI